MQVSRPGAVLSGLLVSGVLAAACSAGSALPATTTTPSRTVVTRTSTSSVPAPTDLSTTSTTKGSSRPSTRQARLVPLPPPAPLRPFAGSGGQGVWHPAGRLVQGHPAVYETTLVPPGSSSAAGIAWMDPHLLRAQLYSGSSSPGGTGWKYTAPVLPAAARSLVAAFNGGFKFPATEGGYYSEGRLVYPLRVGGASFVIYRDGTATVGQWGRDVHMTNQVVAVRQNLTLLVDHGHAVAGLNPGDTSVWGAPLGGVPDVWRSGVGVTKDGALVYVTGPRLEITQLAALLVRAGCVRAMTLDMNPDWTVFATYRPPTATGQAAPSNGSDLVPGTVQGPYTFFEAWWARDFFTMSAR